ncbi:class-II fumarase/aspartase family protein [Tranquillimonas alkanivorans]|uniref:3-carboxy-cis,cis-muconate cycloisomerase n=1 Tax=Tranquillimonas alkanivorans TaxID=441119 RepID=A0A1I5KPF2_9RHOB|nr:adenylosuccinate lyase family protein [Tranquillimonas alkanivorans]SFO86772.1 3-carboxy-cis,cis-muconate cycloisomerase [Tranquillimonas alkanivorans]
MPATPFDSAIYRNLLHDAETARLFTDSAEVRAMLLVEGALAKAQGAVGLIPETAAAAIHRASLEVQVDPAALAGETGRSAVTVPALVKAFRSEMQAPEHAQFVHWGATSQDIMETAQILRLRQVLALWEDRLRETVRALGTLAEAHAETPMPGRTYGQIASPTSFGALVASWGMPLIRHLDRLEQMRPRLLCVSLSGAAGTLSVMGEKGPEVRTRMAEALDLRDPGTSWHATRDTVGELGAWMTQVTASLGKMGEDLLLMTQSGIAEVRLASTGGSSTMPQKQNPVGPSLLVALARLTAALNAAVQGAVVHRQQRDGAAWFTEWLTLPQMCFATGRATTLAVEVSKGLSPDADRMAAHIDDGLGLIYAEALSFALAAHMPRPDAQASVKALCGEALETRTPLPDLMTRDHPGRDWAALCTPAAQLGTAPDQARRFARSAAAL